MACKASARARPVRPQPRVSLESASGSPQPRVSLESASGIMSVRHSRLARVGNNLTVRRSLTSWFSSLILVHKGSANPWLVDNRATLYRLKIWCLLTEQYVQHQVCACFGTLSRFPRQHYLPLARPHALQEYHIVYDQERRTRRNRPGTNKLHCVSTNRLNRVDSELISCLKVNSGLTPAGKTTLNKYSKSSFQVVRNIRVRRVFDSDISLMCGLLRSCFVF